MSKNNLTATVTINGKVKQVGHKDLITISVFNDWGNCVEQRTFTPEQFVNISRDVAVLVFLTRMHLEYQEAAVERAKEAERQAIMRQEEERERERAYKEALEAKAQAPAAMDEGEEQELLQHDHQLERQEEQAARAEADQEQAAMDAVTNRNALQDAIAYATRDDHSADAIAYSTANQGHQPKEETDQDQEKLRHRFGLILGQLKDMEALRNKDARTIWEFVVTQVSDIMVRATKAVNKL